MTDEQGTSSAILVVGGGISGLTAALEAAEVGNDVYLVEKNAYLGGRVAQLNQYFPKLCPPSCGLEINFKRLQDNRRVRIYTMTTVSSVSGSVGNYEVTLKTKPRYVNSNCNACGDCVDACPDERDDDFNFGMNKTKAIYLPHMMAFPSRCLIDKDALTEEGATAIKSACKLGGIDLDQEEEIKTIQVSSIIYATGWTPYDPTKMENLNFNNSDSIITNMMMERLAAPGGPTDGAILRPGDNKEPESFAFVQCAGSRDENHLEFCSYICCIATFKQMNYIRERYPEAKIYVFYIDLRTPGKYESFREKLMKDEHSTFIKGKVAEVIPESDGSVTVVAENAVSGEKIKQNVDMVVLATGMQPSVAAEKSELMMGMDPNGFINSNPETGLLSAGCACRAADVVTSNQSATAAALKAIQVSRRS